MLEIHHGVFCLPQHSYYIFVSNTIDDGIQHRSHHCIQDGDYPVTIWEVTGMRTQIHKYDGSIVKSNNNEMGSASGKSFVASTVTVDIDDGRENANVGQQNEQE